MNPFGLSFTLTHLGILRPSPPSDKVFCTVSNSGTTSRLAVEENFTGYPLQPGPNVFDL